MSWDVEYTNEFGDWWADLGESEQEDIAAAVELLAEQGPALRFPYSSGVRGLATVACASCASRAAAGRFGFSTPSIRDERRSC